VDKGTLWDKVTEPISIPTIRELMEEARKGPWWLAVEVLTPFVLAQRLEGALGVLDDVVKALLLVEWSGEKDHPAALWCKVCRNGQAEGHRAGCDVARALQKALSR
jgi:hypothetical protein